MSYPLPNIKISSRLTLSPLPVLHPVPSSLPPPFPALREILTFLLNALFDPQ